MVRTIAAMAVALAAVPAQAATVFDAFNTFTATNGAGNFNWGSKAGATVTPLSAVSCVINNTTCLGLPSGSFSLPGVFKSTGTPSISHPYQPLDRLLIHPGANQSLVGSFVAPTAGQYSFTAAFDWLTSGPTVNVSAYTDAGGQLLPIGSGFLNTAGQTIGFSGTYALAAGQSISIEQDSAGNFSSDSTGLRFTVTRLDNIVSAVPEPATWGMMIIGFGAIGAAVRRRRSGAFPVIS